MRLLAIASILAVSLAASAGVAAANGAGQCFDKATLSYGPCAAPLPWGGVYFGGHAAYGETDDEDPQGMFNSVNLGQLRSGGSTSGGGGGVHAGVQTQLGGGGGSGSGGLFGQFGVGGDFGALNGLVLGVEFDWTHLDISDAFVDTTAGTGLEYTLDWLASARLRVGLPIDRFMPYVTGGVAWARYEASGFDPGLRFDVEETITGAVAGGGVEVLLDENWVLGAEGLYYFFDETVDLSGVTAFPGDSISFGDVFVARARLSFKL